MHRYCTYFDHRYLPRGLAMIRSLRHMDPGCHITVFCLTPECHLALARIAEPDTSLVTLEELERANPDLLATKSTRSTLEYYFTLTGCIVTSLLAEAGPGDYVTYVDADLMFYSSVAPLYEEMADASVGLIAHRYHWWKANNVKFGYFNVCWTCFRNDETGRNAARWWRDRCIEWCHDYVDRDRFADQKYLDHMYRQFPNVVEIEHHGANVAPWNVGRHSVSRAADGRLVVDGDWPLIFFHFQGFREIEPGLFLINHLAYQAPLSDAIRDEIYAPYATLLAQLGKEVAAGQSAPPLLARGQASPTLKQRYFELRVKALQLAARMMGHYVSNTALFIGPLPDPIMGQAYACQVFLDALRKKHEVHVIDLNKQGLSTETAVFRRIGEVGRIALQARRLARRSACVYLNLSQSFSGNLRDLLIFLVCFRKLPRTAVHLHGGPGMREVLDPGHRLLRFINGIFFMRIGAVIVLSQRYVEIFKDVARLDHVKIVPNFSPESLYADKQTIEHKFPPGRQFSAAQPLRLLFLSNLLPGKGHEELVEAYETLAPEDRARVRIDIAGGFESDEEKKAFLTSIEGAPAIAYHGVVGGTAKEALFHQSDVFCLPTYYRYEGQPISILEAYASGCVVMTTDHSGIFDIFQPGRNGYCVDKGSVVSIRQAIEHIIRDPSDLRQMAFNNRSDAEQYPTSKYNERLVHIVESLMPQAPQV
jgi:glycosyltransferase involved in cell wall biosynthesis